jgi:voltage-gated potassium channel
MNALAHMKPGKAAAGRVGMLRFSAVQFLIFLALFIVSAPFVEKLPNGTFLDGGILTAVLISGVLAVGRSRRILLFAIIMVAPVVIGRWAHEFRPNLPHGVFLVPALAFIIFLIGHLLFFILRAPRVNAEVLCAGLSAYLLIGMAWMFVYLLVAEASPESFGYTTGPDASHVMTSFNAYYFSFITMTTVGYGDIVPLSDVARMLATVEAVTGTLFMAVMIARLVSLYSAHPPGEEAGKEKAGGKRQE